VFKQACMIALAYVSATAGRPACGAPNPKALRLVDNTLVGLSAGRDIGTVSSIQVHGKEVLQDLVENV
jgi:hypothetical protein